jgi:RNA polymerase sigma factor (sigma-70 family)
LPDNKLFSQFVVPHFEAAYNLARWLTGNASDADDVFQEAAIKAHRFIGDLDSAKARAWFLQIVRNCSYTFLKKRSRYVDLDETKELVDSSATPEEGMLSAVQASEMKAALATLPVEYREILILREFDELSYEEIASVTGLPSGTVMSRLNRARIALRKELTYAKR